MIGYFREKGTIHIDQENYSYQYVLELAIQKLKKKNIEAQDLIQTKRSENDPIPSEIQELANAHVKSIKKAWVNLLNQ